MIGVESDTRAVGAAGCLVRPILWRDGCHMAQSSVSTADGKAVKPEKPSPEFPLFSHATGRWAKKIRGQFHYFGPWRDPDGALAKYNRDREDLEAGRKPTPA